MPQDMASVSFIFFWTSSALNRCMSFFALPDRSGSSSGEDALET